MRPGSRPKVDDVAGLATVLKQAGVDFGAEDIADALWLARHMGDLSGSDRQQDKADQTTGAAQRNIREEFVEDDQGQEETDPGQLSLPSRSAQGSHDDTGIPIKAPAAPALRIRLDLARALRPLRKKVPAVGQLEVDEDATIERIADQRIWSPVLKPASERWLDVALVVEDTESLPLWKETISEFQTLLERQGAFRRVTTWRLQTESDQVPKLFPNWRDPVYARRPARARQLFDPAGRRLILLLSDCTSSAWHSRALLAWLSRCCQQAPTTVIQLLPQRLWAQSALVQGAPVWLSALEAGTTTAKLNAQPQSPLLQQLLGSPEQPMTIPVVTLEANPLKQWAKVVAGSGETRTIGYQFDLQTIEALQTSVDGEETRHPESLDAKDRVQSFRTTASGIAQKLAELMSVAPVSPPIVDLIRQTLLPKAGPVHVAEVFMGGLMQARTVPGNPQNLQFDFAPGVRTILSDAVTRSVTVSVLNAVSGYIAERLGRSIKTFDALLRFDFQGDPEAEDLVIPFAEIAAQTLERMGGEYAALSAQLSTQPKVPLPSPEPDPNNLYPLLQTFTFREASLSFEQSPEPTPEADLGGSRDELHSFEFETATLQVQPGQSQLLVQRRSRNAQQFIEGLGQGIDLAMVLIPPGAFSMGSPEEEEGRSADEGPQHEVTFAESFFMAKHPITQTQWRGVATMPQVERELEPDPSNFKGDNRPVEKISWDDAVEFCARLSQHTGRDYRLPTEAEWEYACRAGTTTPFHFGETITSSLANYDASLAYGDGPVGEYREQTTDVGSFPANAFGLYDLHGNVWEWCQDHWHEDYRGAPTDGTAWLSSGESKSRVLRGGSWNFSPEDCRSGYRDWDAPDGIISNVGFRVVCGGART